MFRFVFIVPIVALALFVSSASGGIIVQDISYSQDGVHFETAPVITGTSTVQRYFGAHHHADPRLETAANTDTLAFYLDRTNDELSLLLISGSNSHNSGTATVELAGLPSSTSAGVDSHILDYTFNSGLGTASLTLDPATGISGLSLGNLSTSNFTLELEIQPADSHTSLQLAVGSGHQHQHSDIVSLNLSSPLIIEADPPDSHRDRPADLSSPGPGTSVPEPASLGIAIFGIAGLLARPRRRAV